MAFKNFKILRLTAAAMLISASYSANAQIVATLFSDTNSNEVTHNALPEFINPAGDVRFVLASGVDRTIGLKILKDGSEVFSYSSPRISASDRVHLDGQSFYGFKVTAPSMTDGKYVAIATVYSSSGDVVSERTREFNVHTSAPTLSETPRQHQYQRWFNSNWNVVSDLHVLDLSANVSDESLPVTNATLTARSVDSDLVGQFDGLSISGNKITGRLPRNTSLFPDRYSWYEMTMQLTDIAGNIGTYTWDAKFADRRDFHIEVVGVTYDGDDRTRVTEVYNVDNPGAISQFVTYEPGMILDVYNPRILLKVRKDELYPFNEFGLYGSHNCASRHNCFAGNRTVLAEQGDYAFIQTGISTLERHEPRNYTARIAEVSGRQFSRTVNFGLKEDLPVRPSFTITEVEYSDGSTSGRSDNRNASQSSTIVAVSGEFAQPYSFEMRVWDRHGATPIYLPAGVTEFRLETNPGYTRYWGIHASPASDTSVNQLNYTSIRRDNNPPRLINTDYSYSERVYSVQVQDEYSSTDGFFGMRSTEIVLTNNSGDTYVVHPANTERNASFFFYQFDLNNIADGEYSVDIHAEDNFGNTSDFSVDTITIDNTAPDIRVYHQEQGESNLRLVDGIITISSLDQILFQVSDNIDNSPQIESLRLLNGPANDNVNLSYRVSGAYFNLEYPILFPSLEAGEEYSLEITAIDSAQNVNTAQISFNYEPAIVDLGSEGSFVRLPHIHEHVTRADGMNALYSAPLTLGDGSVVAGEYAIYATMRSDAQVPLIINGLRVNPGDTVDIADAYNFSATGGRFNLEVYPAEGSQPGVSSLLIGSTAPNAPILVADVVTVPMESVTQFNDDSPRQVIDPMNLTVSPLAGSAYCDLTVSYDTALAADPFRDPICLVEFDAPGMNVRTVDDNGRVHLNGFVRGTGEHEISYTVSLLGHQGTRHELAQDSVTLDVRSAMNALALEVTNDISEVQHYVEPVATVLQMQQGLGCDLTSDPSEAQAYAIDLVDDTMRPKCLVEWESVPEGLSLFNDSLGVRGYLEEMGEQPLSWRVSLFYEGDQQLTLATQSYDIDVVEPTAPRVTQSTLTYTSGRSSSGTSHLLRDSRVGVQRVAVTLDEQVYPQIVTINDQQCTIAQGDNRCHVVMDTEVFGSPESNPQGHFDFDIQVEAGAGRDYFVARDLGASTHRMQWDYTPPTVDSVVINPSLDGTEIPLQVGSQQLSVPGDTVAMVVATPFTYLPGTDWHLSNPTLVVDSDTTVQMEQLVTFNDNSYFFPHRRQDLVRDNRINRTSMEVVDGYMVYWYDLSALTDGAFTFEVDVSDQYGNGSLYEHPAFFLQRTAPELLLVMNWERALHVQDLYFTSEFGAIANPGWDGENRIVSASFGGVPLDIEHVESGRKNIARFSGDVSELTEGEEFDLVVQAQDTAGNIGELRHAMRYAPAMVNARSTVQGNEVRRRVQNATINVQHMNRVCLLGSSLETAAVLARPGRYGCYVEGLTIPEGMELEFADWRYQVVGSLLNEDDTTISVAGIVVNNDGEAVQSQPVSVALSLVEPEEIELVEFIRNQLAPGVYGTDGTMPSFGQYHIRNVSGALNVTMEVGDDIREVHMPQQFRNNYSVIKNLRDQESDNRKAFERIPFRISGSYDLAPDINFEGEGELITLPSRRIGVFIEAESDGVTLSTDTIKVNASVGIMNRGRDSVDYDADMMGEWEVFIGYPQRSDIVRVSDVKMVDENGNAQFEVAASDLFRNTVMLRAYAELKSPHPEYSRSLRSGMVVARTILGDDIDASLISTRTEWRVPFTAMIRFEPKTIEDRFSATDIRWELSRDNENWSELEDFKGDLRISKQITEVGEYYIRASSVNMHTGARTATAPIHLAGYDRPMLRLGTSPVAYGQQTFIVNMQNRQEPLEDSDGIARWSLDRGETWFYGSTQQEFTMVEGNQTIMGRFRYHSTPEQVGDDGWTQAQTTVREVHPRPVFVQIESPRMVEMGTSIEIGARVTNPQGVDLPLHVEFHMPNGEVLKGERHQVHPLDSDLTEFGRYPIRVKSWVEGYKEQTKRATSREIQTWRYEMPEASIALHTGIMVAPATASVNITHARPFMPGIEFEYEWSATPGVEVQNPSSRFTSVQFLTPGVHELQVEMRDNRGARQVLREMVDVVEAEPFTSTMTIFPSNRFDRAPLGLVSRLGATGGHPRDYLVNFKWYLNGEKIDVPMERSPMHRVEIEEPGEYEIRVVATSLFGQVHEHVEQYTVFANQPPTCNPVATQTGNQIRLETNCVDVDGFVVSYEWWFNDRSFGRAGPTLRHTISEGESLSVRFRATDDAGAVTEGSFIL